MTLLDADKAQRLELFGEESLDLVHSIEVSFGVEFSSDELAAATTIRGVSDCILRKLEQPASKECLSAVVFYRLRRGFVDLFSTPRGMVHADTPLFELMPWRSRRKRWSTLQKNLGLALPELRWPGWLLCLLMTIVIALVLPYWTKVTSKIGTFGGVLATISVWSLLMRILDPLARAFPQSCGTVGDLTRVALARNYAILAAQRGVSSADEALHALRQLIAAEAGISIEKIAAETSFPDGLNIY